jgi:acetyl-CoA C-acetyltransferase
MEKVPQKLEQTLATRYAKAPVTKYGQRKSAVSAVTGKKKPSPKLREVVLVEACRTPYGRFGGALR